MKPSMESVLSAPYWVLKVRRTKHLANADEFGEPLPVALCGTSTTDRQARAARSRCVSGDECRTCLKAAGYKGTVVIRKRAIDPNADWVNAYLTLMKALVDIISDPIERANVVSDLMEVRKHHASSSK